MSQSITAVQIEDMEAAARKCFNAHVTSYNPVRSMENCLSVCRIEIAKHTDDLAAVFVTELIDKLENELFIVRELPKF